MTVKQSDFQKMEEWKKEWTGAGNDKGKDEQNAYNRTANSKSGK